MHCAIAPGAARSASRLALAGERFQLSWQTHCRFRGSSVSRYGAHATLRALGGTHPQLSALFLKQGWKRRSGVVGVSDISSAQATGQDSEGNAIDYM